MDGWFDGGLDGGLDESAVLKESCMKEKGELVPFCGEHDSILTTVHPGPKKQEETPDITRSMSGVDNKRGNKELEHNKMQEG